MTSSAHQLGIEHDAPIDTWFHIGGRARMLARPENNDELLRCLELDDQMRMLGEGANLLVDDDGVEGLVVSVQTDGFRSLEIDQASGLVRAGSGASLARVIAGCVNAGLGGLEVLTGIPATIGGAAVMNAGGAFGSFCDHVVEIEAMDRLGRVHRFGRSEIDFDYRQSRLNHLIVLSALFELEKADTEQLKDERNRCMEYKSKTQPMSEKSAGCVFKNPVLDGTIEGVGEPGDRVSAGMLIDRAGCKRIRVEGAEVSSVHANFITTDEGAKARSVIELIGAVEQRVLDQFGIQLERELVIWSERTS